MRFVDTSFFYAEISPRDAHHATAVRLLASQDPRRLVTSNHIRGEAWTLIRKREGHHVACEFLARLDSSAVHVARVEPGVEAEALRWLRRRDERAYSFVDATSFAFMRRNGIAEALAFDGDFAAAGFVELRP